jgi:hypothetical protein
VTRDASIKKKRKKLIDLIGYPNRTPEEKIEQALGSRKKRFESATGLAKEFQTRVAESLNCATI